MNIVIVGGGTAGWLCALSIVRAQPNVHNVTLVESKKIGIIGAGEGSTQLLRDFLSNAWFDTGVNLEDFMRECNATHKIGIKHVNWKGDNSWYFAPLDGSSTSGLAPDIELCHTLINNPNKFHTASHLGRCFENKTLGSGSFHFDAFKVGEYFSKIAIKNGVTHIDDEVFGVVTEGNSDNIIKIKTKSGRDISGDFFIDCTGFNRSLCGAIDNKWVSYKNNLLVDSAIGFQLPLDNYVEPVTTAIAMKNGWMWKIPTTERYGCGYVYSSEYTSEENAKQEILDYYKTDIKFLRNFKFEAGRSEYLWKGNCLALGLAAAFAEPLEATSIHTTIMQIMVFVMEHLNITKEDTCNHYRIKDYNYRMTKMYDDFKEFLILHYMGGREDSEFWRYISSGNIMTEKTKYILELSKKTIPSALCIDHYYGCAGIMLYNWILCGLGYNTQSTAKNTLAKFKWQI